MEDLWKIRKRKRMTIGELSSRTGIPSKVLRQYEMGEISIPLEDIDRLARALYVEPWDIKVQSDPPPPPPPMQGEPPGPGRSAPTGPRPPSAPGAAPDGRPAPDPRSWQPPQGQRSSDPGRRPPSGRREKPTRERKTPPAPGPARPSQINHLLSLCKRLGIESAELEAEVGSPLAELNRRDASELLGKLQKRIVEEHPPKPKGKRQRAYLPESVDEHEYNYLSEVQESGLLLRFRLFDASDLEGRVIGFSPYAITLRESSGDEVTIQKLAIAYYRAVPGSEQPQETAQESAA